MKTTLMFRQMIANPRRTTLAHLKDLKDLKDVAGLGTPGAPDEPDAAESAAAAAAQRPLPQRTANPRRTVLTELPKAPAAP